MRGRVKTTARGNVRKGVGEKEGKKKKNKKTKKQIVVFFFFYFLFFIFFSLKVRTNPQQFFLPFGEGKRVGRRNKRCNRKVRREKETSKKKKKKKFHSSGRK
jgi:hypothetical protein